jgi:hypothetical protein
MMTLGKYWEIGGWESRNKNGSLGRVIKLGSAEHDFTTDFTDFHGCRLVGPTRERLPRVKYKFILS